MPGLWVLPWIGSFNGRDPFLNKVQTSHFFLHNGLKKATTA